MAVNFQELLRRPIAEVKRPEAKPPGTYTGIIKSHRFDVSKVKKTPFVEFTLNNVQPGADVDPQQLASYNENFPDAIKKWTPKNEYYLSDDAIFMLKDLIESCKLDTTGRAFDEVIPELVNQPVQFNVTVESFDPGDGSEMRFRNKIGTMTGA